VGYAEQFVYVVKDEEGIHKIGMASISLEYRLRTLAAKSHKKLELICSAEVYGASKLESILHRTFARKRVEGEWFDLDQNDITRIKKIFERWPAIWKRRL